MPFRFVSVCDLLENLDQIVSQNPPYLPKESETRSRETILRWFRTHRSRIDDHTDGLALLSTLLPEHRTDRVYGLKEKSLEKVIARALALPNARRLDLERWREPGAGDIGDCVERVQRQGETSVHSQANGVSVEEIDSILSAIASRSRYSSPAVRSFVREIDRHDPVDDLATLYRRLQARESKWLTRLILKSYAPVELSDNLVCSTYHYLLPNLLRIQADMSAALRLLADLKDSISLTSNGVLNGDSMNILKSVRPLVGTKIGRQPFFKARSMKHCVEMAQARRMSIEKKYDGEYCQIHIDMSQCPANQIKIFSKSGRDSTTDRAKVQSVIRSCLRLDENDCKISHACVLEGELLVYSDKERRILDFYKLRKHISRSGSFVGIDKDSQPHEHEHLMIAFYDILVFDNLPILELHYCDRIQTLDNLVRPIPGRIELAERQIINFARPGAAGQLRSAFAKSIIARGEGMVVKPADEPYFNFENHRGFKSCCIKMKKGYIGTFGDVGDFAVIGASYDAVRAKAYGIPGLPWTDLYLGCLSNKEDVTRWDAKPRLVIVATVSPNREIMERIFNHFSPPHSTPYLGLDAFELRLEKGIFGGIKPSTIFTRPFVLEISCFDFDKGGNTGFWTMRFPHVTKFHHARMLEDTVSFTELQAMAEYARSMPKDLDSQEDLKWIRRLEVVDLHLMNDGATQSTSATSACTPSPRRTSQDHGSQSHPVSIRRDKIEIEQAISCTAWHTNVDLHSLTPQDPFDLTQSSTSTARNNSTIVHHTCPEQGLEATPAPSVLRLSCRSPLSDIQNSSTALKFGCYVEQPFCNDIDSSKLNDLGSSRAASCQQSSSHQTPTGEESPSTSDYEPCRLSRSASVQARDTRRALRGDRLGMRYGNENVSANITGQCIRALESCPLNHCTFALAPSVTKLPWLTENLLPSHGVTFTCSVRDWQDASTYLAGSQSSGRKVRKIILVESNRKLETRHFLDSICSLDRNHGPSMEWVAVYDWRLLESVAELEMGKTLAYDMWRHHWVGTTLFRG